MKEFKVFPDAASLARAAAQRFMDQGMAALKARRQFVVALSGGTTPRATYEQLASKPFAHSVFWPRAHVFWGDERCVPPDHPDSNYRMARQVLLDTVPIPVENIHRIQGELPPDQAAAAYQAELEAVVGNGGRFDLILLGMGTDGHTGIPNGDTRSGPLVCRRVCWVSIS